MKLFRMALRERRELEGAFEELDVDIDAALAQPAPTLLDEERRKSDALMDDMRGRQIALEVRIEALTTELTHVRQVIHAETVRAGVLFTDRDYSPSADSLGSYTVAIEEIRKGAPAKRRSRPATSTPSSQPERTDP